MQGRTQVERSGAVAPLEGLKALNLSFSERLGALSYILAPSNEILNPPLQSHTYCKIQFDVWTQKVKFFTRHNFLNNTCTTMARRCEIIKR